MADDGTKLIIVLEAQSKKLQNQLVDVTKQIDRFAAQTERRFDSMQKKSDASFAKLTANLKSNVGGLQNLLAPLAASLSVEAVIRYSDAWTEAGNKIAAASSVAGVQARSLDDLKKSANGARTELAEYVDLYSRLLRASSAIHASELQVAQVTDIVAKSLKAGGASAQEQQASLIQLGQALSSGFLQGDELRSLRENAPLLARAIAKEFGVTIGQLKQLGADGKLSSERVFKAILNGGKEIEDAFAKTRSTIHDAFTRINNEFTAYIGTAGQAGGATQALVEALNFLADNFKEVGDVVIQFVAVLTTALLAKGIAGVVAGLAEAVVALGTFLAALEAGTLTAAVFSAALGPIALLAAGAAVAIGYMVYAQGAASRAAGVHTGALNANNDALSTAIDGSQRFRDSLKRNVEVQLAAARAAATEAKAQLLAHAARAANLTALSGLPAIGPLFQAGGTYENGLMGPQAALLKENEKFASQLQDQLDAINKIMQTPAGADEDPGVSGGGSEKAAAKYKKKTDSVIDATEAILRQTEAQRTLNPLVNDYGYAVDVAKTKQELLTAAQEAGLKITPELKAGIDFLAEGYATAAVEAAKLTEAQTEARDKMVDYFSTAKGAARGFIDDLVAGKSAAEALGGVFQKLGDKLIDLGLDSLFGTGQGSSPFGAIGSLFFHANGGIAANGRPLKTFARGGVSNTAAIFGETGQPEAAVPLPDGRRIPVDLRLPANPGSGATHVSIPISIDASGADPAAIARLERTVSQMKVELPHAVIGAVRDAKKRLAL
jgi:tape measure domain-containing protein